MSRRWKVVLEGNISGIEASTPMEALSKLFEAFALTVSGEDYPDWPGFDASRFAILPMWKNEELAQCSVPMCIGPEVSPGLGLCSVHFVCPFCGIPYSDQDDEDAPPSVHPYGLNLLAYTHHIDADGNEVVDTEVYCDRCGHRYSKRLGTDIVRDAIAYHERILPQPGRVYGKVAADVKKGEEIRLEFHEDPCNGTMMLPEGVVAGEDLKKGQLVRRKSFVSWEMVHVE